MVTITAITAVTEAPSSPIEGRLVLTAYTTNGEQQLIVDSPEDLDRQLDELFYAGLIDDDESDRLVAEFNAVKNPHTTDDDEEVAEALGISVAELQQDRADEDLEEEEQHNEDTGRVFDDSGKCVEVWGPNGKEDPADADEEETPSQDEQDEEDIAAGIILSGPVTVPDPPKPPDPIHFTVITTDMAKELELAGRVAEKGSSIPILRNVLIRADGGGLTIRSTDLDRTFTSVVPNAVLSRYGAIVIDLQRVLKLCKKLAKGSVMTFSQTEKDAEDNAVNIACGKFKTRLAVEREEHFPNPVAIEDFPHWIEASELNRLINQTDFCITKEESRYALNGALLESKDGNIKMVATDGHRLALSETIQGFLEIPSKGWIIRKDALSVLDILTKEKGTAGAYVFMGHHEDGHLAFSLGQRQLSTRLLEGQFPNYDLVIPKDCEKHFRFNPTALREAIGRLDAVGVLDERSHGIGIYLEEGELCIGGEAADVGKGSESIPCLNDCAGFDSAFNSKYMLEFFAQLGKGQEVVVDAKNDQSPIVMRPAETGASIARIGKASMFDTAPGFLYVVMPMRLGGHNPAMSDEAIARKLFSLYDSAEEAIDAYLKAAAANSVVNKSGVQPVEHVLFRQILEAAGLGDAIAQRKADQAWKSELVPVLGQEGTGLHLVDAEPLAEADEQIA